MVLSVRRFWANQLQGLKRILKADFPHSQKRLPLLQYLPKEFFDTLTFKYSSKKGGKRSLIVIRIMNRQKLL